jgi:hypothetical protein
MPAYGGTLIVAALLILALAFAGSWIVVYVRPGGDPWRLLPWFGAAAVGIIAVGLCVLLVRRGKSGS